MFPPNSIAASISSRPFALTARAKNSPPTKIDGDDEGVVAFRDREASPAGLSMNGIETAADNEQVWRLKIPMPTLGIPSV